MSRRKHKPIRKEPAMRITKGRRKLIDQLAEQLCDLAPATSPGKGFCVRKMASDMKVEKCWTGRGNKKTTISAFLQNVFRSYPQKPKKVVLSIVEGGLHWKAKKGEEVTRGHLDAIVETMAELGFNLKKEMAALKIPEPSPVRPPTSDITALFDRLDLHEALKTDITDMFRDGHFNEAVRKALERFEKHIQNATGDHKTIGKQLMAKAFNLQNPLIPINQMKTGNDQSEQEGFMHLTMGAMAGLRNLYSHGDVEQMTAIDAIERLGFVSLLFKRVDKAISNKENDHG